MRLEIVENRHPRGRVGDLFACHHVANGGHPIPTGHRAAFAVQPGPGAVAGQHGVAVLDVAEIAQDRLGRAGLAMCAEVPLQIADPKDQLGHGGGPGVHLNPQELVRVNGMPGQGQGALILTHFTQQGDHLAFEPLHQL